MERYTTQDILQILTDFYNCQSAFDPNVTSGHMLSFQTTTSKWMDICDLVEPKKLAKSYHDTFHLDTPVTDLEKILSSKYSTLNDLCNYMAKNAVREKIVPIKIMDNYCLTASIFKTLIANLNREGVNTANIRPSTKLKSLFNEHGTILLTEVNK